MFLKINEKKILDIVVFILVLLWSGSPYQTIFPVISYLQIPVACILLFLILTKNKGKYKTTFYSVSILVFSLMILLTWVAHLFASPLSYLREVCFIFLAFALTRLYNFKDVVKLYVNVMTFVAIVSLVGHLLVNNTQVLSFLPQMTNVNNIEYGIGVIFNYLIEFPERNCGIFWEPGIYASFLSIAIIFEICFNTQRKDYRRLILFFFTLVTTSSSAGMVLILLCATILFMNINEKTKKNWINGIWGLLLMILLAIVVFNFDSIILMMLKIVDNLYLEKLLSYNIVGNARYLGLVHNLKIFFEYPLFGAGLDEVAVRMDHVADISTSTYLMSIYGLLGAFYTISWIRGILGQKRLAWYTRILFIAVIMIIVNKETHTLIIFSWMLMFYFLKQENVDEGEIEYFDVPLNKDESVA